MENWITLWTGLLWISAAAFLLVTIFIIATSVRTIFSASSDEESSAE